MPAIEDMTDAEYAAYDFRNNCGCGSGLPKEADYDGHGCFLFYHCAACYDEKRSHYRADIYEAYECDEPIDED